MSNRGPTYGRYGMGEDDDRWEAIAAAVVWKSKAQRKTAKDDWIRGQDAGGRAFSEKCWAYQRLFDAYMGSSNSADREFAMTVMLDRPLDEETFAWAAALDGPRPPRGRPTGGGHAAADLPLVHEVVGRVKAGEDKAAVTWELAKRAAGAGTLESKVRRLRRYPQVRRI